MQITEWFSVNQGNWLRQLAHSAHKWFLAFRIMILGQVNQMSIRFTEQISAAFTVSDKKHKRIKNWFWQLKIQTLEGLRTWVDSQTIQFNELKGS